MAGRLKPEWSRLLWPPAPMAQPTLGCMGAREHTCACVLPGGAGAPLTLEIDTGEVSTRGVAEQSSSLFSSAHTAPARARGHRSASATWRTLHHAHQNCCNEGRCVQDTSRTVSTTRPPSRKNTDDHDSASASGRCRACVGGGAGLRRLPRRPLPNRACLHLHAGQWRARPSQQRHLPALRPRRRRRLPQCVPCTVCTHIGKPPRAPNNLIIYGAVRSQISQHCLGVVCPTLPVVR